jgi:hypothetical protein
MYGATQGRLWPMATMGGGLGPMTAASSIRVELKTLSCKGPNQVEETHRTRTKRGSTIHLLFRFVSSSNPQFDSIASTARRLLLPTYCLVLEKWRWSFGNWSIDEWGQISSAPHPASCGSQQPLTTLLGPDPWYVILSSIWINDLIALIFVWLSLWLSIRKYQACYMLLCLIRVLASCMTYLIPS